MAGFAGSIPVVSNAMRHGMIDDENLFKDSLME